MSDKKENSLIEIVNPKENSTVMIYDVHASESGALAILDDLYQQIKNYSDKSVQWIFIVSVPKYEENANITVKRYPWVKKNWLYRLFFETFISRKIIKKFKPDKVFSLQNKGVDCFKGPQYVYLHLPFVLSEHRFEIKKDGKKIWMYQNIMSNGIFRSLRKAEKTIVQTRWMKEALIKKGKVENEKIVVLSPDVSTNNIKSFEDCPQNRKRFFYPATSFAYKNHMTLLKAIKIATEQGLDGYEMIFTIKADENDYTRSLSLYVGEHHLNVIFGGPIPREHVFELYAKSILLFPSYVESFGLPLLEARESGTYIIASDCSFSKEILDGYEKARFFPEMDENKMAEEILSIAIGDKNRL